jgi:hypothetical protein
MLRHVGCYSLRAPALAALVSLLMVAGLAEAREPHDDKAEIAATNGIVVREGDRIKIRTKGGNVVALADGPSCWDHRNADRCVGHALLRHDWARGLFVIERYYYEGADHILVDDRTGAMTLMQADPRLSPMGDVAIELVYGEHGYYAGRSTIIVWRRVNGKFKREWSEPIEAGHSYSILGWPSNDRFDVEETISQPDWMVENGKRVFVDAGTRRFSVIREGQRWRIERGP